MLFPHTVELVRITEVEDEFGQPVDTETTRVESPAFMQAPTPGNAAAMGRDVALEEWAVFLPPP